VSENFTDACTLSAKSLIILASIHGFEHIFFHFGGGISAKEHFKALLAASRRGQGVVVSTLIANETSPAPRAASDYSEVVQAAALGHHWYILETLLDSFTEALRQATQLKFNEVVNILRQRGVTLPEDSG
jgi:hypothetical protein